MLDRVICLRTAADRTWLPYAYWRQARAADHRTILNEKARQEGGLKVSLW